MQKSILLLLLAVSTTFVFSCQSETKTNTTESTNATTAPTEEKAPEPKAVANDEANFIVDAANSSLSWIGSKAVGDQHKGNIKLKDGSFVITDGQVMAGQATIDMNTINNMDLDGKWKLKLEGHLKGPDFFDVAKFPTATINVTKNGDKGFKGELTMRGVTKPVTIPATVTKEGDNFIVTLQSFKIDRTEWGVKYNSGKFFQNLKDKLINDDIEFSGKIVLTPKG